MMRAKNRAGGSVSAALCVRVAAAPCSSIAASVCICQTTLASATDFAGLAQLNIRGHSSLRYPKHSYAVKLVDDSLDSHKASLLKMPKESAWVLYGPYPDKTLMRDVHARHPRFLEAVIADASVTAEHRGERHQFSGRTDALLQMVVGRPWLANVVARRLACRKELADRLVAIAFGRSLIDGAPDAVMAHAEVHRVYLGLDAP